jgi:CRP-like cAMP-binding protein
VKLCEEDAPVTMVHSLKSLPLFRGLADDRVAEAISAFHPVTHRAGSVLFNIGEVPSHFELLTEGDVSLEESPTTRFELRAVAPLGELGALTGIPRSTKATAATDVTLLTIPVGDLRGFFDANADIGFAFYKNLMSLVSDKVRRDRRRLSEMRANIIRTQKAMKSMRDTVLSASETAISKPLFESLDKLIDGNRRANYRVSPPLGYEANVRLDDGRLSRVLDLSEGYLKIEGQTADLTTDPSYWAGVLVMPTAEILVSGTILREDKGSVVIKLDTLVDEFKEKLDDYSVKLQLLDYVI